MIQVNTPILNRTYGQIVKEGEKDYETFKGWAENKDRNGGVVICEFVGKEAAKAEETALEAAKLIADEEQAAKDAEEAANPDKAVAVTEGDVEPDRKAIIEKLKEKGITFFAGAKTEVLLEKLKEAEAA